MDFMPLDDNFVPSGKLVTGYSSLIWTERYVDLGGFELNTPKIEETMELLPEESYVGIRESNEVMRVGRHLIEADDLGVPKLKITGQSFETIFKDRALIVSDDPISPDYSTELPGAYLKSLIEDKTSGDDSISGLEIFDDTALAGDILEEPFPDPTSGDLYTLVYDILKRNGMGIRNNRLVDGGIYTIIYYGYDRTITPGSGPVGPEVVFRLDLGDILDYSYMSSTETKKNVAYVISPLGFRIVTNALSMPTGVDRRVLQVDASDLTDSGDLSDNDAIDLRGMNELAKTGRLSALDGQASLISNFKFGVDYGLGDKVTFLGMSGITESRRITEFVRSQDVNGEKGWPTLSAIETEDD